MQQNNIPIEHRHKYPCSLVVRNRTANFPKIGIDFFNNGHPGWPPELGGLDVLSNYFAIILAE
ncbi:MAG: hypothetical protein A3H44_14050 [Gammaproteobacteria bacterium RIFCSPLOWO2_02_FULL_57_10]|nr:MAG: hypothetical protein A3H44_14050 [Gammaproteobacteria bacterium RIFCSPLOWO2_02_FULL_57_10]